VVSVMPPGVNGTIQVIGRVGNCCDNAGDIRLNAANKVVKKRYFFDI
jgi:hypothetical protein